MEPYCKLNKFYKKKPIILTTKLSALLILFMVLTKLPVTAQIRGGILPTINYNQRINKLWEANLKLESRHFLFQRNPFMQDHLDYEYSLSDLSLVVGRKISLSSKLVVGALLRLEPEGVAYRTIQQLIVKSKINTFRVAHRFVADQTFSAQEAPEFRLRYRLSGEIPLSGQQLDVQEFYVKMNVEMLHSLQSKVYDLEFRIIPHLGYVINKQHKIELGLDNRLDSFLGEQTRFTTWFCINWYITGPAFFQKK